MLSEVGCRNFEEWRDKVGTVGGVQKDNDGDIVRLIWDHRRSLDTLHPSFLQLDQLPTKAPIGRLPTRHPNVPDEHAEPKDEDDERRR